MVDSIVVLIQLVVGAAAVTIFGWVGFAAFTLAYLLFRVLTTLWWNRV